MMGTVLNAPYKIYVRVVCWKQMFTCSNIYKAIITYVKITVLGMQNNKKEIVIYKQSGFEILSHKPV